MIKQSIKNTMTFCICLSFLTGCSVSSTTESTQDSHPEMADPFPSGTFNFTKAIPDVPNAYIEEADQQGSITTLYYNTKNYDGDGSRERKYCQVYTPYQYTHSQQYNIFYLMHGYSGNADDWLGTPEEASDIKNCIDHLIEEGSVQPMIIVALSYYDNNTDEETDNWDIYLTAQFYQEFQNDVMPAVESMFSTYAQSTDEAGLAASRDHRGFGGFSMGGVTTWYQFQDSLKYVKYFYPASGSPYWGPDVDGKDQKFGGNFALNALNDQGCTKNDFYMYMTTGSEDYARSIVEAQINSMELFPDTFTFGDPDDPAVNVSYGISDGEDHNYHARLRDIYSLLPVFSKKMI